MMPNIGTIVRCSTMAHRVFSSVRSVTRCLGSSGEVVIVTDDSTPPSLREWLRHFAGVNRAALVHAPTAHPGAAWNAGIRATAADWVLLLNAGDGLDPAPFAQAVQRLDVEPVADLLATGLLWTGPGAKREIDAPSGCSITDLLGDSDLPIGASLIRRKAWESLEGFDEALPCLELNEFWLRALSKGCRGATSVRPCLVRPREAEGLHRQAWDQDVRAAAIALVLEKHRDLFRANPVAALFPRERRLHTLGGRYRSAIQSREAMQEETAALRARIERVRQSAPADVNFLRRTTPVSRDWGYERGTPVDRFYIEEFLDQFAPDIRGVVLEVQESDYTKRFGRDRVTKSDVVDLLPTNPRATIVSDLRCAANIPTATYDCVILTQTIHVIDDMNAVFRESERILKLGGVLLATLPSASRVCLEYGDDGDHWRVTEGGARALLSAVFPADGLRVAARGNALVNAAFLYGLAVEDLTAAEFAAVDPYFPLVVTVRAQKSIAAPVVLRDRRGGDPGGAAILLYHRIASPDSDVHGLSVSAEEFRHHLDVLTTRYQPLPLDELSEAIRCGEAPPGAIALTFDDGYLDNATVASPLLEAYGIPATFFLTTDGLNGLDDYEYWWDVLERTLLASTDARADSLVLNLAGESVAFDTSTAVSRLATHRDIYDRIVTASSEDRDGVIKQILAWSPTPGSGSNRRLRRAEVVSLAAKPGHAIGAHSAKHLMLPRQSPDVEAEEITSSRRSLEAVLGRPIRAFAYPFGAYSDSTVRAVSDASYDIAVTCDQWPLTEHAHRLRLPRLDVTQRGGLSFEDWLAIRLKASTPAAPESPQTASHTATASRRADR